MALYFDLPVYKTTYQLLLSVLRFSPNVPRDVRYTLLSRLIDRLEDLIGSIYEANATRDKVHILATMRREMSRIEVELRLLADLKAISQKHYAVLIEQSDSISKQLSAWHKNEIQKANLPNREEAGMPQVKACGSAQQ